MTAFRCNCRSHSASVVEIAGRLELGNTPESSLAGTAVDSSDAGKMKMVAEQFDMSERVC